MDQLVSGEWLEKELGVPDLRVLDCSVVMEVDPESGRHYRPGGPNWEQSHIPGSAHVDLFTQTSDASSPYPFMLPPPEQFSAAMSKLGSSISSASTTWPSTTAHSPNGPPTPRSPS
jgi:thiosulfate/3-mercaptopyruvate sulfurtransferase